MNSQDFSSWFSEIQGVLYGQLVINPEPSGIKPDTRDCSNPDPTVLNSFDGP